MIDRRRLNLLEAIQVYQHDLDFEPHSMPTPTAAAPGSLEKMRVMSQRLLDGEELHHPNDERIAATMELQGEMGSVIMAEAKAQRERLRELRPKNCNRASSLHAARVTKQRIAEVRQLRDCYSLAISPGNKDLIECGCIIGTY